MREWSCCLINILANSQYCFQLLKFNDPLYLCFHTIQKPSIAKLKQLSKAESVFYNIHHQWESSIKVSSAKINSFQTSNRDNILVNHQSESQLILTLTGIFFNLGSQSKLNILDDENFNDLYVDQEWDFFL